MWFNLIFSLFYVLPDRHVIEKTISFSLHTFHYCFYVMMKIVGLYYHFITKQSKGSRDASLDGTAVLHWLSAVDRVNFKVVTLVYRCLHDLAQPHRSASLHRVDSRRRLRSSADTEIFLIPRSVPAGWTVGDRSFPVAGQRTWNYLLETVCSGSGSGYYSYSGWLQKK